MAAHQWLPVSDGVMLWKATTQSISGCVPQSPHAIQMDGHDASSLSKVNPDGTNRFSQQGNALPAPNSSKILQLRNDCKEILTPDFSQEGHTTIEDFLKQMENYANGSADSGTYPDTGTLSPLSVTAFSDSNSDYDSDGTDFLPSKSPCPTSSLYQSIHLDRPHTISRKSPQNKNKNILASSSTVLFKKLHSIQIGNGDKLSNKATAYTPLQHLRALEKPPPHPWTHDERELLCILYRWFDDSEAKAITMVFNHITGLCLRSSVIQAQFHSHIRLYGGEAYPEYTRVMNVPFSDPKGEYHEMIQAIQETAASLDLQLKLRAEETIFDSGWAKFAKSPRTRRKYKSLVQRAAIKSQEPGHGPHDGKLDLHSFKLGAIRMILNEVSEDEEHICDADGSPISNIDYRSLSNFDKPSVAFQPLTSRKPCLAFRVWDESNQYSALFNGGFVARAFADETGPLPAPMPQEYPYWKYIVNLHLSKTGDMPMFISTATSLLQTMCYSIAKQSPRMAVIDLSAKCLEEKDKLFHAAKVFPWLKNQGLAQWARYQGGCDYFCSVSIPKEAVLHTFAVEDLWELARLDPVCDKILYPQAFQPGRRTKEIAAVLRDRDCILDSGVSGAIGRIARICGMHELGATHVTEFLARLVDGFYIQHSPTTNMDVTSAIASEFATHLCHTHIAHEDIVKVFLDGINEGTKCAAHWSRSSSTHRGNTRKR